MWLKYPYYTETIKGLIIMFTKEIAKIFPNTTEFVKNEELTIGKCSLIELANTYGTPLYVFDEDTIRERCQTFTKEFRAKYKETHVAYASKAFINQRLTSILSEEGMGMDVVSLGEFIAAKQGGMDPRRIHLHGNNKSYEELEYVINNNIGRIIIDNFSKFGFAIETGDAEKAIQHCLKIEGLDLVGIHCHIGSQIFEIQPYNDAMNISMSFAAQMVKKYQFTLSEISIGGGFAIAYTQNENPPSVNEYAEIITNALKEACENNNLQLPKLIIEPGRAIAGPSGVAVYKVGSIKNIPNIRKYVSVDGGMGDNIRPALYQSEYEAVVLNKISQENTEIVTIAGKYCESGDILIKDINLPTLEKNDLICIPASGAYCIPMSSNYNMSLKPAVILVKDGKSEIIRKRETYDDILSLEIL
jgi:diaminopimelate decarboxylase